MTGMMVATDGPVAPAEAWRRYSRFALWPAWAPQIKTVTVDGETLSPGASGQVHGPVGVSVNFEILTVEAEKFRWSWRVWRGPFAVTLVHGIEPNGSGGSRSWIDLQAPVLLRPAVLPYLPLAWYALHRHVTLPSV